MAGGHDKVAIAVYKGDCDAGVTFVDTALTHLTSYTRLTKIRHCLESILSFGKTTK